MTTYNIEFMKMAITYDLGSTFRTYTDATSRKCSPSTRLRSELVANLLNDGLMLLLKVW